MIMKRFCHAILACGVFAAIVAAVSCTKDATGGGGGGYDGEPEVNHDMDGILRRNYLWNEEYATLSPDFGLPYDEFLDGVLMRMRTNDLDKKFRNGRWQLYSNIQRLSPVSRTALSADIDSQFPKEPFTVSAPFPWRLSPIQTQERKRGSTVLPLWPCTPTLRWPGPASDAERSSTRSMDSG